MNLGSPLLIDGVPVRTATGVDKNLLARRYWDVRNLQGQSATLQIIDCSTEGFLLVDEFMLTKRTGLRDISSHRATAQLVGNPEFTSRQSDAALGNSLRFDGVDDGVEAHVLEPLADTDTFTLSSWVKIDDRDRDQVILSKGEDFSLRFTAATAELTWQVGDTEVASPRKIDNAAWHFVAASFKAGTADGLRL